ncbi:helix-turn-helix domain-containing protein [Mycobacterium sp.]|uniref:PucR family transcriptional regulator n=1 Tax=Mycobacterium sp. TaxID=1785 RepID=UPI002D6C7BCB|nr:helix-turn-helix domain-containing protein [Mycobacterium sp.]HZA08955.1 helix-turn-helix domain-containing protein [Mycobacterium sp.]
MNNNGVQQLVAEVALGVQQQVPEVAHGVQQQVAEVAQAIHLRTDELAVQLALAITREVHLYDGAAPVPVDVVAAGCAANMRPIFAAIAADAEFDTTAATELGVERAHDGMPLSSVMEAYRVGFHRVWDAVVTEAASRNVSGDALRTLTAKLLAAQEVFTDAMAVGYRDEQTRTLRSDASQRSMLMDSLLHGRVVERWSLWEAADHLRLPTSGPYVVIAAEVAVAGSEALPNIESKLRSFDVFSAWRLLPDVHVGIVHVRRDKSLGDVLALVSRLATARVGVSARFDDLRDAAQALRFARMMLVGRPDPGLLVSVFDGSILASAAVSAPEVLVKLVTPTIDGFAGLADQEREVLFETFRAWVENDGSMRTVGDLLFCHPNTVRYRLHRIERCTGRSLSNPRDLAELCLAFEVQRRLM